MFLMDDAEQIRSAVVRANRAWASGQPQGVAALFDEDVVMATPQATLRGRPATGWT